MHEMAVKGLTKIHDAEGFNKHIQTICNTFYQDIRPIPLDNYFGKWEINGIAKARSQVIKEFSS